VSFFDDQKSARESLKAIEIKAWARAAQETNPAKSLVALTSSTGSLPPTLTRHQEMDALLSAGGSPWKTTRDGIR